MLRKYLPLSGRWGRKIAAKGRYRDPVRSKDDQVVMTPGLQWVSLMLLTRIGWARIASTKPLPNAPVWSPTATGHSAICAPIARSSQTWRPPSPVFFLPYVFASKVFDQSGTSVPDDLHNPNRQE